MSGENPYISDEELFSELRAATEALGRPPSINEMEDHGDYSKHTFIRRFGSWDEALEAAGIDPSDPHRETVPGPKTNYNTKRGPDPDEIRGAPGGGRREKHCPICGDSIMASDLPDHIAREHDSIGEAGTDGPRPTLVSEGLDAIEVVHGAETRQDVETVIDEGREAFRDDGPEIEEIDAVIRCPGCRANPAPVVLVAGVWHCHFCGEGVEPER